jgi:hypothetical protein
VRWVGARRRHPQMAQITQIQEESKGEEQAGAQAIGLQIQNSRSRTGQGIENSNFNIEIAARDCRFKIQNSRWGSGRGIANLRFKIQDGS